MSISSADKVKLFKEYGGSEKNTGSVEAQVALFTHRINHMSKHLDKHKKDFSTERSLLKLVGKRKRLLKYLAGTDIEAYRSILEKLKLRK